MASLCEGDALAFDELYGRYSQPVLRFLYNMLWQDEAGAQDMLQEVFLEVVEQPEAFNRSMKFSSWLFSIARNKCKNAYRHAKVVDKAIDHLKVELGNANEQSSVEEQITQHQLREILNYVLDQLGEAHKTTFTLRYQEDYSIKEISDVLGCSDGTTKSRLHYAMRAVKAQVEVILQKV